MLDTSQQVYNKTLLEYYISGCKLKLKNLFCKEWKTNLVQCGCFFFFFFYEYNIETVVSIPTILRRKVLILYLYQLYCNVPLVTLDSKLPRVLSELPYFLPDFLRTRPATSIVSNLFYLSCSLPLFPLTFIPITALTVSVFFLLITQPKLYLFSILITNDGFTVINSCL